MALIHLGFTYNLWVESTVGHFQCSAGIGGELLLQKGIHKTLKP